MTLIGETEKRAAEEIRVLRSIIYKLQLPENQSRHPGNYLDEIEKAAYRRAIVEDL